MTSKIFGDHSREYWINSSGVVRVMTFIDVITGVARCLSHVEQISARNWSNRDPSKQSVAAWCQHCQQVKLKLTLAQLFVHQTVFQKNSNGGFRISRRWRQSLGEPINYLINLSRKLHENEEIMARGAFLAFSAICRWISLLDFLLIYFHVFSLQCQWCERAQLVRAHLCLCQQFRTNLL